MATASIHSEYVIKCPRNVDSDQVNIENFKEFIPPNIRATQVKGLTSKKNKFPCSWEIAYQFLEGNEEDYQDNKKRYELRKEIEKYKPRNTIILTERAACERAEHFWIFKYQIICDCTYPPTGFLDPET